MITIRTMDVVALYQSRHRRLHISDYVLRDAAFQAERTTKAHRHTSTAIYHVLKGQGRTGVGEGYLEWQKGDSFIMPLWQWHAHENSFNDEAILFSINDRPVMESLQLYREESR